ncbi:hypothetical protein LCGC14_2070860, partial [marine sediment metagenome]
PDIVYMISYLLDASLLMRQSMELKMNPKMFVGGAAGFTLPEFSENAGKASEKVVSATLWHQALDIPGASAHYDNFLKLFPKSRRAVHAELRSAESFHLAYRGPLYDETPLVEAEHRYRAFAASHPAKAAEVQVERKLKEIHALRAAKGYHVGRFYLRTDQPEAAEFYFRLVVKDYAGTRWAGRARAAMAKLAGGPAKEKPSSPEAPKEAES